MKLNKKVLSLAVAGMLLVAGLSIESAMAYFTTYVEAGGSKTLDLEFPETQIDEKISSGEKQVVVKNTGEAECFVRVKIIVAAENAGKVGSVSGENWKPVDGYYEYQKALAPDESTSTLVIRIEGITDTPGEDAANFNVIIVQECVPVLYGEDGTKYADWDAGDFVIVNETTVTPEQ